MINKIDDSVASKADDEKLQDIGLAYGNIKVFRKTSQQTCYTTASSGNLLYNYK